jgi:protease I
MTDYTSSPGRLAGKKVGVLMESDYVESEISYYLNRFAEEGAEVVLLTRLWGAPSLTFTGHEYRAPIVVDADLERLDYPSLAGYAALIVPGGMVSDRLRYSEDPNRAAPAVELLRRAFRLPHLVKGVICHGMWLLAPAADLVAGRTITCHNNLVADVRHMGAHYVQRDVVVDGDLVTASSVTHTGPFARAIIDLIASRREVAA